MGAMNWTALVTSQDSLDVPMDSALVITADVISIRIVTMEVTSLTVSTLLVTPGRILVQADSVFPAARNVTAMCSVTISLMSCTVPAITQITSSSVTMDSVFHK